MRNITCFNPFLQGACRKDSNWPSWLRADLFRSTKLASSHLPAEFFDTENIHAGEIGENIHAVSLAVLETVWKRTLTSASYCDT